jgi:Cu-processing system ATP-binding protein
MTGIIEVEQACKRYGEIRAVDGVSLSIERGELFGLIGHNGAGKTTLFKLMLGLLPLSSGAIRIDGKAVQGRAFREVRRRVGYLPENVVLYDNLSVLETLWFFADLKRVPRGDSLPLLEKVGLAHAASRRVRGLSKGMRQRLGFAQALLGNPALLFLDEPTTGLDPEGIREFYSILNELRERGVTAILSSHILAEIQQRVDRLALMNEGRVYALGTVTSLRSAAALQMRIMVTPRHGNADSLQQQLAAAGIQTNGLRDGQICMECQQEQKMALLGVLSRMSDQVADIQIHEPSLEDIFHGYAVAHWPAHASVGGGAS